MLCVCCSITTTSLLWSQAPIDRGLDRPQTAGLGAGEALDGEAARRHAVEAATAVGDGREAGY